MQTDQYDAQIMSATHDHLPGVDWRLVKAQLFQESRLDPQAKSHAGAMGIAQFMPATWKEIAAEMGMQNQRPTNPGAAIPACCFYMSKLLHKWSANRPTVDRYCLALASYNAGFGNILEAQELAKGAMSYAKIIAELPAVTGKKNANETSEYVKRIYKYYHNMIRTGSLL
jgi:membrane-bound lytic murein transglycosylase MltF